MNILEVRIKNFRSIKEVDFKTTSYTVLVGKNNEGKSNVMKAIDRFWNIIKYITNHGTRIILQKNLQLTNKKEIKIIASKRYNLEGVHDDIPIELVENENVDEKVIITVYFGINNDEVEELKRIIGKDSKIGNKLYIEISYDINMKFQIAVKINLDGGALKNNEKIFKVIKYVEENFDIDYIPSIRTEETATDIVQRAVSERMRDLKSSEEYNRALKLIDDLQEKELEKISKQIEPDIKRYLNDVESIEVSVKNDYRHLNSYFRNDINININDGKLTSLSNKGDGIKSLIALSILQTSESNNRLLMIDEPEAHLHSGAIRELKDRIMNDTTSHQTFICTHHQIFIDRTNIANNIVLKEGRLLTRPNIRNIRRELGVSLGENLLSAEIVVLVEGGTDKEILNKYIEENNGFLHKCLKSGKLVIDQLGGASNLLQRVELYESGLCKVICMLDNDNATKKFVENESLKNRNIFMIPKLDKKESEIEDIFETNFIFNVINDFFDISNSKDKKGIMNQHKFTDGLEKLLDIYGRTLSKSKKEEFKWYIISEMKKQDEIPLKKEYKNFFETLSFNIKQLFE